MRAPAGRSRRGAARPRRAPRPSPRRRAGRRRAGGSSGGVSRGRSNGPMRRRRVASRRRPGPIRRRRRRRRPAGAGEEHVVATAPENASRPSSAALRIRTGAAAAALIASSSSSPFAACRPGLVISTSSRLAPAFHAASTNEATTPAVSCELRLRDVAEPLDALAEAERLAQAEHGLTVLRQRAGARCSSRHRRPRPASPHGDDAT